MSRLRFTVFSFAVALVSWPALADDSRVTCIQFHETGQAARNTGKLGDARAQLEQCARATCPELVRVECARLLDQVQVEQPTVLLSARDAGGHDVDAQVLRDGAPWIGHLDGAPVPIDPGDHVLEFRTPGARVEERVVIRTNEKNRAIAAVLTPPSKATPPPPANPPTTAPARRSLTAAWVFMGVAVSAAVGFGAFAGAGFAIETDHETSCAPRCTDAQLVPIRAFYGVADASMAIAGVSLVTSLIMFAVAPKVKATQLGSLTITF